ncbi:MAG: hypothetical protein FWD05_01125 [Oscillospiraceae bacterium]|nr:hypothetical protein [Oscillospiraceae bacterium]
MWNRIKEFPRNVQQKITEVWCTFKNDQRGLSGVVVAILLILVAVLAVVLIWLLLGDWLNELWERIVGSAADLG